MQRAIKLVGLALLYVVAFLIVELLGMSHPYLWTYSAVPAAVLAAWPYYKLNERYPLPGIAMLCAVLLLMINFLFGQGHIVFALGCVILGFIAEGFRKFLGNYRSRKGTIASYIVMAFIPFTKTCVWWINFELASDMSLYNYEDIYYATKGRMLSYPILGTMLTLTLILSFVSIWFFTRHWHPRERYREFITD